MILSAVSNKLAPTLILVAYILMMIGIAIFCRKKSSSLNDFFLAGRGLGGWMTAFAYGTTYFSSVIFVGYAGKFGWTMGLGAIWIGIGNALIGSFLAWKLLAKRTRCMTHYLNARTMPEFFEYRYNSKGLKLLSAIIIFTFLVPYSASVYQGLGYLFEQVFGIKSIYCVLIMAGLTALYLFFGGYFATALSDFVQGIIMLVGVVIMVVLLLNSDPVKWGEGLTNLWNQGFDLIPSAGGGLDSPLLNLIVLVLLTSFGVWGLPQSVHKFYAVKSNKSIKQAMVVSTVFCLVIGFGAYFTGALGHLFFEELPEGGYDMIVPTMLTKTLPPVVLGLIVVLVLSASMSTLASLSLAGASSVAVDAYKGFINKNASDKKVNWVLRIFCLFFVLMSVLLAVFKISAIVTLMSLSWGVLAGCFIGPYVLGLYSKKVNKNGAYASMIFCLVLTVVLIIVFGCIEPKENGLTFSNMISDGVKRAPLIGVICMAVSVIVTYVFSLIFKDKNLNGEQIMQECKKTEKLLDEEEKNDKNKLKFNEPPVADSVEVETIEAEIVEAELNENKIEKID